MRLYAGLKWLASRVMLVDNYCRDCGRKTECFDVQGDWEALSGQPHPLCFRHFARRARQRRPDVTVWHVAGERI